MMNSVWETPRSMPSAAITRAFVLEQPALRVSESRSRMRVVKMPPPCETSSGGRP